MKTWKAYGHTVYDMLAHRSIIFQCSSAAARGVTAFLIEKKKGCAAEGDAGKLSQRKIKHMEE